MNYVLTDYDLQVLRHMRREYQRRNTREPRRPMPPNRGVGDTRTWAEVSSNAAKDATYYGKSAASNKTTFFEDATGALNLATYYDFSTTEDVVLVNYFETGVGSHILPVNCVVFGWQVGVTGSGKPLIELDHFFAGVFPVALTQTGGGNHGTGTADWTYTVKTTDSATTLGTAVGQTRPRQPGLMTAGTRGLAYYDGATLKLWDAGETPQTAQCT